MSTSSKAKGMAGKLDLIGAVVAIVLGILLLANVLNLEEIIGITLLVVGVIALARNV